MSLPQSPRVGLRGVAALAVLGAIGAGLTCWLLCGPIAGDRRHDFGLVVVGSGGVELTHTFALRNRTTRPLTIAAVSTSCGCSRADASTDRIEPGARFEVIATLSLKTHKRKHANIFIDLGADGVVTLSIAATGQAPAPPGPALTSQ